MMRAQPCRCVVVGRTEPLELGAELLALRADELQEEKIRRFRELRAAEPHLTPAQFEQRHWFRFEKSIEIARNLAALRASGAEVEYRAVDLGRAREARAFVHELLAERRRVDVVLHGAGSRRASSSGTRGPRSGTRR
jgi:NAD(P)-dependent dehydrogenase (short-subunit alcohol dehydrogenase family)